VTAPDQCCSNVKKALAMAPSTRDPKRTFDLWPLVFHYHRTENSSDSGFISIELNREVGEICNVTDSKYSLKVQIRMGRLGREPQK